MEVSFKKYSRSDIVDPINEIMKKEKLTKRDEMFKSIADLSNPKDLYYMFYMDNKLIGGSSICFLDDGDKKCLRIINVKQCKNDVIRIQRIEFEKNLKKALVKKCMDMVISDLKTIFPEDTVVFYTLENSYYNLYKDSCVGKELWDYSRKVFEYAFLFV